MGRFGSTKNDARFFRPSTVQFERWHEKSKTSFITEFTFSVDRRSHLKIYEQRSFWWIQIDWRFIPAYICPLCLDKQTICLYSCSTIIIKCIYPNIASIEFFTAVPSSHKCHILPPFSYQVPSKVDVRTSSFFPSQSNRHFPILPFMKMYPKLSCTAQ